MQLRAEQKEWRAALCLPQRKNEPNERIDHDEKKDHCSDNTNDN